MDATVPRDGLRFLCISGNSFTNVTHDFGHPFSIGLDVAQLKQVVSGDDILSIGVVLYLFTEVIEVPAVTCGETTPAAFLRSNN